MPINIPGTPFFKHLQERVNRLEIKYPKRPKRAILSLIFWSCKYLFRSSASFVTPEIKQKIWRRRPVKLKNDVPKILFFFNGGIGDTIMASTYLKEFHKFIGETHRYCIGTDQNLAAIRGIFNQCPWIDQIYTKKEIDEFRIYDAVISLTRIPRLIYCNSESQTVQSPSLQELFRIYNTFEQAYYKLCACSPYQDTLSVMYSMMNGHTRHTQPDIKHILGMSDETRSLMVLDENAFDILTNTGLINRTYITIQRGIDESNRSRKSTKLWPWDYYNELIRMLHVEFPSLSIVQVGRMNSESDLIGVDVDLRGQTSFEELKAVLKHSALHIDGECGLVHLTHALGGRSAVFFGPTNIDFFKYPENINVKAKDACPLWCEWVTDDWQVRCLRGFDVPPCMKQLTPELFFDAIREHLHEIVNEKPVALNEIHEHAMPQGTILFLDDYDDAAMDEWVRPDNHVLHFSMNLTPEMIRNKKERQIDADYADILNIPMKKESCDAVFCSREQKLSEPALHELKRILKTGGLLKIRDGSSYRKTRPV